MTFLRNNSLQFNQMVDGYDVLSGCYVLYGRQLLFLMDSLPSDAVQSVYLMVLYLLVFLFLFLTCFEQYKCSFISAMHQVHWLFFMYSANLPPQIGSLQRLETLLVEHNNLVSVPPAISGLRTLRHISLAYNDLRAFPVELCSVRTLDVIDLSHNKLTEVPDAVKDVNAIEINLNQNQVKLCQQFFYFC